MYWKENRVTYGMLWSNYVFVYNFMLFKVLGEHSPLLKGSEAVYQSYEGYFNMAMYLLEVDSLTTDEGGVEVTGKSHVFILHLQFALIN